MFGQTNLEPGVSLPPMPGVDARKATGALAHEIAAVLNKDLPTSQIIRALKRYNDAITPVIYSVNNTFAAVSATATLTVNVDNSYGFFGCWWTATSQSTDRDFVVTSLTISTRTDLIVGDFPVALLTRWTNQPLEFFWFVPANSNINLAITNGATTAANQCYFSWGGYRVPNAMIQQLMPRAR